MFRMNSEAVAVIIALILVLGSMFGVDRIRIRICIKGIREICNI